MSKLRRRLLAALVIIALFILIFCVLFRVFVTNRIMDGGCGMENPDIRREEAKPRIGRGGAKLAGGYK